MTEQVKRYHKSFIGLMEQCKDGAWVRSEDFDLKQTEFRNHIQKTISRNTKLTTQVVSLEKEVKAKEEVFNSLFSDFQQVNESLKLYKSLFWLVICVYVLVGVYHG